MSEHAALPWSSCREVKPPHPDQGVVIRSDADTCDGVGSIVAPRVWGDANAAFIVRACNAHDELVAALENAWRTLDNAADVDGELSQIHKVELIDAACAIRATLAKS